MNIADIKVFRAPLTHKEYNIYHIHDMKPFDIHMHLVGSMKIAD
jgi:hypothetical protein